MPGRGKIWAQGVRSGPSCSPCLKVGETESQQRNKITPKGERKRRNVPWAQSTSPTLPGVQCFPGEVGPELRTQVTGVTNRCS